MRCLNLRTCLKSVESMYVRVGVWVDSRNKKEVTGLDSCWEESFWAIGIFWSRSILQKRLRTQINAGVGMEVILWGSEQMGRNDKGASVKESFIVINRSLGPGSHRPLIGPLPSFIAIRPNLRFYLLFVPSFFLLTQFPHFQTTYCSDVRLHTFLDPVWDNSQSTLMRKICQQTIKKFWPRSENYLHPVRPIVKIWQRCETVRKIGKLKQMHSHEWTAVKSLPFQKHILVNMVATDWL